MRRMRFLAFALISFVAALFGTFLSPSTWFHKSLAVALCGVLSANPALCTNNAIIAASQSQEASATNPVKVETPQFSDLLAQRSREFLDDTPPSIPQRINNPSVNRNNSLNGINTSIPTNSQRSQNNVSTNGKLDLNGEWLFVTSGGGKPSKTRGCGTLPPISELMSINQSGSQIFFAVKRMGSGSYAPLLNSNRANISGKQVEWMADSAGFSGTVGADGNSISGNIHCGSSNIPFQMTKKK